MSSIYFCLKCRIFHQCQDEMIDALRLCPDCGAAMKKIGSVPAGDYEDELIAGGYF